jgi:Xaa-Pro aminopeptidase
MREHGIDLWVIMSRENNVDPALDLFGAYGISGWYGHRNAYLFYDAGEAGLETTVIGTHLSSHLDLFYGDIRGYGEEGLAPHLREYLTERDPGTIAVNRSYSISMADGLSAELEAYLMDVLGDEMQDRVVSSEPMFIDYVSTRTSGELEIAKEAANRTWAILRRAFSSEVITPGETTLMDVYWWVKDEWMSQDLEFNFPASFNVQRRGLGRSIDDGEDVVIQPGDVLHVDFGVKLMGIVTDQQKMGYVLRPGETDAPEGLRALFAQSVRAGEIIAETIEPGVLGRDVVTRAQDRALSEGITSRVYPHVQGNWVHGVGAWASFDWPERYGRHPREPVRPTEFWSIEYNVSGSIAEWDGQTVTLSREEDAWVGEDGNVRFMVGPQKELWLIGQPGAVH